jgi:two-component system, OmpR family, sensor histidine kinase SenX3
VIGNLLENAVRYSPDGGEILLRVDGEGAAARLAVKDSGIGIPADAIPRLFQPYFRHDEAKQLAPDGMGIGLFVTRQIVLAHGGDISVESKEGQGTTFTVILPREPGRMATPDAVPSPG